LRPILLADKYSTDLVNKSRSFNVKFIKKMKLFCFFAAVALAQYEDAERGKGKGKDK
jgi:hypothetical protein